MILSSKILSELCALLVSRFLYDSKMHSFYLYQFVQLYYIYVEHRVKKINSVYTCKLLRLLIIVFD